MVVFTQAAEAGSAAVAARESVDDDPAADRGGRALGSASSARTLGGVTGGPILSMDAVVAALQRTLRDGRRSRDRHDSAYRALHQAVVSGRRQWPDVGLLARLVSNDGAWVRPDGDRLTPSAPC